jgi:hypothetical protein
MPFKMMLKYNVLAASAILGVLHGTWHFVADYLGSIGAMGSYWLPHFLIQYSGAMTVTRILIGWVYPRTRSVRARCFMPARPVFWLL